MTRPAGIRRRNMLLSGAIALAAAAFTLSACSDDNGATPCNLDTGASSISGNLTVHYEATTTGDGTLSSVTYATDAGNVVVTNPALPWNIDITLATASARLQAVGGVSNGTLEILYQAVGPGEGNTEDGEDSCSN